MNSIDAMPRCGSFVLPRTKNKRASKMELVVNAVDYGNGLEIPVTGIASVERISEGQVRVSYYRRYTERGRAENRIVLALVWDLRAWRDALVYVAEHRAAIERSIGRSADCDHIQ